MAKQAVNRAMDKAIMTWLTHKGLSPDDVMNEYSVKHTDGMTYITLTLVAQDFPLQHAETKMPGGNTNRPHPTCIDVTRADQRPYSSWVCGPDCPPMSCAFHEDCREAAPDASHIANDECA